MRIPGKKEQRKAEMCPAVFQVLSQVIERLCYTDNYFMNKGDNRNTMYF